MNDRSVEADLPLTGARATFVAGTDLTSATMYILGGARLRCAVAYWGAGAERRFDPATLHGAKLICNLGGATDPDTIRKLMATGAQVRMDRNLHAKVYISDRGAVISSANQSANGLGDGNGRQPLWREAGVVLPPGMEADRALAWFSKVWHGARTIEGEDLAAAAAANRAGRTVNGDVPLFGVMRPDQLDFLIAWTGSETWVPNRTSIRAQMKRCDAGILRRIHNGAELEAPTDLPIIRDRWVLWWDPQLRPRQRLARPLKEVPLAWSKLGTEADVVENAYSMQSDGSPRNVLLEAEHPGAPPFDISETLFVHAFHDCLEQDAYRGLLEVKYPMPWFTRYAPLMARFRVELYTRYHALAADRAVRGR